MKTKKFFMTFLLAMGMIIAKAANGFAPELVLVSQPVLTYNTNSVTIYYDIQNIGDYTYRGDIYLYLDPDDGYYYAKKHVRICSGKIKRVAISIPAYRPNPSWVYTVMPYYELGDQLYSFTIFEYFEPVRFCWYGYRDEPWVVVSVGPRVRYYHRPTPYRYYYDGYYPILPPPPGGYPPGYFEGLAPLNPTHHTYAHHHNHGGYPATYHPNDDIPGYNNSSEATVARPSGANTPGSMSSRDPNAINGNHNNNTNNNAGVTTRPSSNSSSNSGRTETTTNGRRETSTSGRTGTTNSRRDNSSTVTRPSTNSSSNSGRTETTTNGRRETNTSGRTGNSNSGRNNSGTVNRSNDNSSSSRNSRSGSNTSNNGGRTPSGPSRGR